MKVVSEEIKAGNPLTNIREEITSNDMQLKITVIVPVYNVAPYLPKCIDSIRNQTYQNLEIIVIDDGSTDGCGEICDAYAKKDERIRVVHQKNQGLSAARNTALDIMTGDLVGFVDSDDWIEPDYYEQLERVMKENGADVSVNGYYKVYQNGRYPVPCQGLDHMMDGLEGVAALEQAGFGYTVWNKLYRRELWDSIRFPAGHVFEDVLTTWKVLLRAQKVICIKKCGYNYIARKSSICNTPALQYQLFEAHLELYKQLKQLEYRGKVKEGISEVFLPTTVKKAYVMAYRYRTGIGKSEIRRAKMFWKQNRRIFAGLGKKYWLASRFPRLGVVWIQLKSIIRTCIRSRGYKKLFE